MIVLGMAHAVPLICMAYKARCLLDSSAMGAIATMDTAYSVCMFSPRFSLLFPCPVGVCDPQSTALIVSAVGGAGHLIREPPAMNTLPIAHATQCTLYLSILVSARHPGFNVVLPIGWGS